MHCLTYSIGLDTAVIDFVISLLGEPNADSALQAHQVQASHGVPISTIPAQAGPSAESGLTGPGLRNLAEVSVKATARSLRAESLPRRRDGSLPRLGAWTTGALQDQDGGANRARPIGAPVGPAVL